jgi:hypothetical protein
MNITINNKEYGLHWGMGAIEIYCDRMNCELDGLDKIYIPGRDQGKAITNLILAALQNYGEINNAPADVTYRQLQAFIDESDESVFKSIMDDFAHSKYLGKTIMQHLVPEGAPEDTPEKKSPSAE